jgi:pimeloyl-ACP methyl ester carboxylesterase
MGRENCILDIRAGWFEPIAAMALRSLAGGSVLAEVLGEAPARVLALHGWGRRGSDFVSSLQGLPVVAVDLPGFGASPPPPAPVGAAGYAELVAPVLEEFPSPPLVVGHSFGGRVAVALAAARPEEVDGLLLTGVPLVRAGPSRRPRMRYRLARLASRLGLVADDRMERLRRRHGSADYAAADGVMRAVLVQVVSETYERELATLRGPVHLLWGSEDREVSVEVARRALAIMTAAGARASLELVEGGGHHLGLEAPDRLREAVERMLR